MASRKRWRGRTILVLHDKVGIRWKGSFLCEKDISILVLNSICIIF